MDPLTQKYPFLTPYQFASNTPIGAIDLDGLEAVPHYEGLIEARNRGLISDNVLKVVNENAVKGMAVQVTVLADIFFTKGWLTRSMMAYEAGNMIDYTSKAERTDDPILKSQYQKEAGKSATIVLGGALLDVGLPCVLKAVGRSGILKDANFAQSVINKARVFSEDGQKIYSEMAGTPIKTVDNLVDALKAGTVSPSQLKLDYVVINGQKVILNTRTSVALSEAGIPKSKWVGIDRTGVEVPGMTGTTFDDLAKTQIKNNKLPATGTPETPK